MGILIALLAVIAAGIAISHTIDIHTLDKEISE